jgi:hypothetical protein
MRKILAVVLVAALAVPSAAAEPLEFSARIKSETLAEEAIDLLHCLSEALDIPWELGEGGKAPYRLNLREENGSLSGAFISPEGERSFRLSSGEARSACAALAPAPEEPAWEEERLLSRWEPPEESRRWLWSAVGAAALTGAFFLWKSRQPKHRSFRMDH